MIVAPKVSLFVLAVLALWLFPARPAYAGAFLLEPGQWQLISTFRTSTSRQKYDEQGRPMAAPRFVKAESSVLMEYGLHRDVTVLLIPTIRYLQLAKPASEAWAIGSLEMGARWRLADFSASTLSFQGLFRVPTRSDPAFVAENRARGELRLGYGQSGFKLAKRPAFADVSLAWIKRDDPWREELRFDLTLGWWQFSDQLLLLQWYQTLYPGVGGQARVPQQVKFEVSNVYKLKNGWSLQLGTFASTGGISTRAERGSVTGLWRKF